MTEETECQSCSGTPHDAIRLDMQSRIKEHGHTFLGVFDPTGTEPPFVYSIGLTQRGWPELLLIGNMPPRLIEYILATIIEQWKLAGKPVLGLNDDVIKGRDDTPLSLMLVPVDAARAGDQYACQVANFYPDATPSYVQVLWPDDKGVFPTDPAFNSTMQQPVL